MKKVLLFVLSMVLVAAISIGATLAYLQDLDSDVNVMTLGNVQIEQVEQERDKNGNLVDFTKDKPAYPAVGPVEWADEGVEVNGDEYKVFTPELKNVVDKIVTVNNTGKSDAYIRTIVAIEAPDYDPEDLIHINYNKDINISSPICTEIDGVDYVLFVFTYEEALKAGEKSVPSLMQVFLDSKTTNEDCASFGDNWEILVMTQAVQAAGFPDAKTALDTAFGAPDEKAAEWFGGVMADYIASLAWDGASVDTTWYDPANTTQVEYDITTAAQLAGLAELVADGNTFEGKTLRLGKNIDLGATDDNGNPISFEPIGDANNPFKGTFDGQGYTIENLYQSGWAFGYEWGSYGSIGLFGSLDDATIKNVTIKNAEAQIEGGDVGGITGSATGDCTFENITITGTKLGTYNNGLGGIIGWSGAGNYTFKNINIDEDTVLGGLWGSFDSSIGGVVGQGEPGATYIFEDVDIACRLDVYNDCTASYDYYNYRMCGMIIGRLAETTTIDGVNYPDMSKYNIICNNVTVTYGDWHNYHYCEPTPGLNGGRGMRVEAGYEYGGLPVDYDHSQCVDNHMNLIPFDQIFGGDQIAVKGLKTYDGVTVNYPN